MQSWGKGIRKINKITIILKNRMKRMAKKLRTCQLQRTEQLGLYLVIKICSRLQHQTSLRGLAQCLWNLPPAIRHAQRSNRRSIHSTNPCIDPPWLEHLLFSTLATDLSIYVKDKNRSTEKVSSDITSDGFGKIWGKLKLKVSVTYLCQFGADVYANRDFSVLFHHHFFLNWDHV